MKRTKHEISLLETRQTLTDLMMEFKGRECIDLIQYRSIRQHLVRIELRLRDYRDHLITQTN